MRNDNAQGQSRSPVTSGLGRGLAAITCLVAWGCSDGNPTTVTTEVVEPSFAVSGAKNNMVVVLQGEAEGQFRDVDGVTMLCYDVDLVDPETDRVIGAGSDCLDLATISGGNPAIEGFAISNTTIFDLPGGTIKSRNRTTIQPVLGGSPGSTHTAGDVAVANNILEGTGRYRNAEGVVQLFGSVDLSRFFSEAIIGYRTVYIISVD